MYRSYSSQTTLNLFMPKFILIILSVLALENGYTQANGTWIGIGEYLPGSPFGRTMNKMAADKVLVFHVATDGKVSGNLATIYNPSKAVLPTEEGNQFFNVTGKYDAGNQSLLLVVTHLRSKPDSTDSYLTFRFPDSVYYALSSGKQNNRTVITGIADPLLNKNATTEWVGSFMNGGLRKTEGKQIDTHVLPLRIRFDNEAALSQQPTVITQSLSRDPVIATIPRFTNIQRTIILDTSFIKLDLYDNGEIDGDIATLVLDGKVILDKQLLSARAATVFLNLAHTGKEHTLELFANNLGTIPPNTALLVLTCNKKRYEINLSSDEVSNGTVKLVFKD